MYIEALDCLWYEGFGTSITIVAKRWAIVEVTRVGRLGVVGKFIVGNSISREGCCFFEISKVCYAYIKVAVVKLPASPRTVF